MSGSQGLTPSHARIPPRLRALRPPPSRRDTAGGWFRRLVRPALVCLAIALGLLCLFAPLIRSYTGAEEPTFVEQIELRVLDWHARLRGPLPPPANVTIVAIDETSLELVGRWPWPRTRTTEMVLRLAEGGARVIALDLILREPDENNRLVLARTLAERFRALGLNRPGGPVVEFGRLLEEALTDADTDEGLAQAMAATRRVVVPYFFVFPPHESRPLDDDAQRLLNRSRVVGFTTPEAEQLDPRAGGRRRPAPAAEIRQRLGRERSRQRATGRRRRAAPRRAGHPAGRRPLSEPDARDRASRAGVAADAHPFHARPGGPGRIHGRPDRRHRRAPPHVLREGRHLPDDLRPWTSSPAPRRRR